ncbi:MAG: hypothetical protein NUV32_10680 [Exilispira sp.]|jgi:hypothetical protein|nr:hypothetical protein [Exilispira sp.]
MKRSIIILIALVLFISLPVFASTPEEENAPAATSEDSMFMDLTQLSEEELMRVEGNAIPLNGNGNKIYNENTGNLIDISNGEVYKMLDPSKVYQSLNKSGLDPYTAAALTILIIQINQTGSDLFVMD